MYETYGCVTSASKYGCVVYANTLDLFLSNTTSCEETILCVLVT